MTPATPAGASDRIGSRDPVMEAAAPAPAPAATRLIWAYFALGVVLGVVALKAELVSWFRIQEMFRLQAFHMYGILGSAVAVAAASIALLKRLGVRTADGEPIRTAPKAMGTGTRYWAGGVLFGGGWALTGACPGPFFVLIGAGADVFGLVLLCALAGMWSYGHLRPRLPH